MPDFYFRGKIDKFWQVTLAEADRLSSIFGPERLEFLAPNPKLIPLSNYRPKAYDEVHFIFWEAKHTDFLVRVRASNSLGSDWVQINASLYTDPIERYGESNLDVWEAYINALRKQEFLVTPTEFLTASHQEPREPGPGSDRQAFHIYFERVKDTRYKYTFNDLAKALGVSEGHAKRLHRRFLGEHSQS